MNKLSRTLVFIGSDWFSAGASWLLFFMYRKEFIEPQKFGYQIPIEFDRNFYSGIFLIPLLWLFLYALSGSYHEVFRKSRVRELTRTFNTSVVGVLLLFFAFLLDDTVSSYKTYYQSVFILFGIHFTLTFCLRYFLVLQQRHWISQRRIGFNTLIIGNSSRAMDLVTELERGDSQGFFLRGFIQTGNEIHADLGQTLPSLGGLNIISDVVRDKNIEEVIIAIESSQHPVLNEIINELEGLAVRIRIIPDMYDILSGSVKTTQLFGTPLITVNTAIMPEWQFALKRLIDVLVSATVLLLFWPLYLLLAAAVKMDGKGPVFYHQERIGFRGKPFSIHKFRTMRVGAEQGLPQLSGGQDDRRTRVGKVLRKYRLDELPQVWNVLVGEMSLVGPRPERQFFIDQIVQKAPHYKHLLKVRPGITSWGQVKYGYAENVDQMVDRLKFDVIYIENMSLALDFRILFYTIWVVVKGRGK